MASSHDKTNPRGLLQGLVTGTSALVCADLRKWNRPFFENDSGTNNFGMDYEWWWKGDFHLNHLSFQRMQTLMDLRSVNYFTTISKNKKSWAGICGKLKMFENFGILWKCFPVSYQKFSENQSNAKRLKIGTSLRSFFNSVYMLCHLIQV